ncbi:MAG: glycosyltransferase family 9 protein [Hyphomonadaceae bacterium]|nr:glycosyltransferase family 9 protein [Hyphomonadaceae bacterium]
MARILFITSNRIGDAVLSTGVLEHAMARHPGAAVVLACGPLPAPLFRATPGLERTLIIRKQAGRWRTLWEAVRRERFDLAIDLRGSLITLGVRAKRRIIHRKSRTVRHKLEELAALLDLPAPPPPRLHLDARALAEARAVVGPDGPVLALGAGANFIGKRWPPDRFAALARALVGGPLAGATVLLLGAPEDAPICGEIAADLASAGVATIDAAGRLDLLAAAAALSRAALFVGNDSGLMHVAAAVGAPTLGLFGPSDERVYGPWGARTMSLRSHRSFEDIQAVGYMPLIEFTLMDDLPVDTVVEAALRLIGKGTAP